MPAALGTIFDLNAIAVLVRAKFARHHWSERSDAGDDRHCHLARRHEGQSAGRHEDGDTLHIAKILPLATTANTDLFFLGSQTTTATIAAEVLIVIGTTTRHAGAADACSHFFVLGAVAIVPTTTMTFGASLHHWYRNAQN